MNNILSIDLESWNYIYNYAFKGQQLPAGSSERKTADNNYVPEATAFILDLLDRYNQTATFFILGEIYDWYPEVLEDIEKKGHELGYHSHTHRAISNSDILEEELKKSYDFFKRFKPAGFRAPEIYITRDSFACLKKYGFKYSSSTYAPYKIINIDGIDEIPVSALCYRGSCSNIQQFPKALTLKMLSAQIPFGSGLFIALIGSLTSYFINSLNRRGIPAILFFHPWQLYRPEQITGSGFKFKMLYRNPLSLPYAFSIEKTLKKLLARHSFVSFQEYYEGKY